MATPLMRSLTLHRAARRMAAAYGRSVRRGLNIWFPETMPRWTRRVLLHWSFGFVVMIPIRAAAVVLEARSTAW
jgi:hypothetical protein